MFCHWETALIMWYTSVLKMLQCEKWHTLESLKDNLWLSEVRNSLLTVDSAVSSSTNCAHCYSGKAVSVISGRTLQILTNLAPRGDQHSSSWWWAGVRWAQPWPPDREVENLQANANGHSSLGHQPFAHGDQSLSVFPSNGLVHALNYLSVFYAFSKSQYPITSQIRVKGIQTIAFWWLCL